MLNPKDVASKKFDKAAMFGYKTEEVDEFLSVVSNELTALNKEKAELEKKLEILANKVREYRNDEDALKDALLGAQKQGNLVVSEAKRVSEELLLSSKRQADDLIAKATETSESIIRDSEHKNSEIINDLQKKSEYESNNLTRLRKEVSDFKSSLLSMYKVHLSNITQLPEIEDKSEDYEDMSKEIENDLDETLTFTEFSEDQADVEAEDNDTDTSEENTIQENEVKENTEKTEKDPFYNGHNKANNGGFGELQFGKNNE